MSNIGISTNKKIIELYNLMKEKTLVLAPSFQRKLVWNDTHKSNFIDTILREKPFPEVYFADGAINLETKKNEILVVDGQQRLSTIYQYITGDPQFKVKGIRTYEQLSGDEQTAFLDYVTVVRNLGRLALEDIKDIFKRINSVRYALNAVEINNALYEGDFISTGKGIIDENAFFEQIEVFNESDVSRMKDLEFILLVMSTVEEGAYFNAGKEIEKYVKKYDDLYPEKDKMLEDFQTVLNVILNMNIPSDSLWLRRANFFILVVELIWLRRAANNLDADDIRESVLGLEKLLMENNSKEEPDKDLTLFYYYTHQNVGSRMGRRYRGDMLRKYLT